MKKYFILCVGLITYNIAAMLSSSVVGSLRPTSILPFLQAAPCTMPLTAHRFSSNDKWAKWIRHGQINELLQHHDAIKTNTAAQIEAATMAADAQRRRRFCGLGAITTGGLSAATFFIDLQEQLPTLIQSPDIGYTGAVCATMLALMAVEASHSKRLYEQKSKELSEHIASLKIEKGKVLIQLVDGEPTKYDVDETDPETPVLLDLQLISSDGPKDQECAR